MVILEALQQKTAVISTNVGGIPDIITDNETGLIVKSRDSASLANAIAKLLDSADERKRIGENGYIKYKELFTIDKFEENMINILKSSL